MKFAGKVVSSIAHLVVLDIMTRLGQLTEGGVPQSRSSRVAFRHWA
jgi:hypothetical protein